jgi:hypothetical protein
MPTKPASTATPTPCSKEEAPLSLQAESSPPRVRERRPRASAVLECRALASAVVRVELPAAWEASERYTVLTVALAACPDHARELERRAAAVLAVRADLHHLLAVAEAAIPHERGLRARADVAEAMLGLASDRAGAAERALDLVERDLEPHRLRDLVPAARAAAGVDLAGLLRRRLARELASGADAGLALERVRRAGDAMLAARGRRS